MKLPESLYFLRAGWWLVHVAGVGAVFAAGFFVSHHLASHHGHAGGAAGHHDHTSPEVLQPLMRQMLVDSVQLQGALSRGDLPRAAKHADAIAGACEDGGEKDHGALPKRLGPSFVEHDRKLHGHASGLGKALRAGKRDEAVSLSREMFSACQSCHKQAPAAAGVDLSVVEAFSASLTGPGGGAP